MILIHGNVEAQDTPIEKRKTRQRIEYFNYPDSIEYFQSYLYASEKGVKTEIENETIKYFALTDTGEVFIREVISNEAGKAYLIIGPDLTLPIDSLGNISIIARFEGNELFEPKEVDIDIQTLELNIEFLEKDSMRLAQVVAINPTTDEAISGIEVKFFVERMFSPLLIESELTDDSGIAEIEFPADIPGDVNGFLDILIKIDDDDIYGNYESKKEIAWGIQLDKGREKMERALWSPYAPTWMVVVFVILMGTVWGHYVVILVSFYRIKKDQKNGSEKIQWDDAGDQPS